MAEDAQLLFEIVTRVNDQATAGLRQLEGSLKNLTQLKDIFKPADVENFSKGIQDAGRNMDAFLQRNKTGMEAFRKDTALLVDTLKGLSLPGIKTDEMARVLQQQRDSVALARERATSEKAVTEAVAQQVRVQQQLTQLLSRPTYRYGPTGMTQVLPSQVPQLLAQTASLSAVIAAAQAPPPEEVPPGRTRYGFLGGLGGLSGPTGPLSLASRIAQPVLAAAGAQGTGDLGFMARVGGGIGSATGLGVVGGAAIGIGVGVAVLAVAGYIQAVQEAAKQTVELQRAMKEFNADAIRGQLQGVVLDLEMFEEKSKTVTGSITNMFGRLWTGITGAKTSEERRNELEKALGEVYAAYQLPIERAKLLSSYYGTQAETEKFLLGRAELSPGQLFAGDAEARRLMRAQTAENVKAEEASINEEIRVASAGGHHAKAEWLATSKKSRLAMVQERGQIAEAQQFRSSFMAAGARSNVELERRAMARRGDENLAYEGMEQFLPVEQVAAGRTFAENVARATAMNRRLREEQLDRDVLRGEGIPDEVVDKLASGFELTEHWAAQIDKALEGITRRTESLFNMLTEQQAIIDEFGSEFAPGTQRVREEGLERDIARAELEHRRRGEDILEQRLDIESLRRRGLLGTADAALAGLGVTGLQLQGASQMAEFLRGNLAAVSGPKYETLMDKVRAAEREVAKFNRTLAEQAEAEHKRTDALAGIAEGFRQVADTADSWGQRMTDVVRGTAESMDDAMSDSFFAVIEGRFKDLGSIAEAAGKEMVRLLVRQLSQEMTAQAFSGLLALR